MKDIPLDDEKLKRLAQMRKKSKALRARFTPTRNRAYDNQMIPFMPDNDDQMRRKATPWYTTKTNTVLETLETNLTIETLDGEAVVNKEQTETLKEENENISLEILFIIDKSGSMSNQETVDSIIEGFNRVIKEQKAIPGKVTVSTLLFDCSLTLLHDRVSLEDVKEMTSRDYLPTGTTALLDAVGTGINHIFSQQQKMPESQRPEKTLVVIMTDGEENASVQFKQRTVKRMITLLHEKRNWEFLYFGANVDHFVEAEGLGIDTDHAWAFETKKESIKKTMNKFNTIACFCRCTDPHQRHKSYLRRKK